jgi:hypothetical protein
MTGASKCRFPELSEESICIRAMLDSNVSKLVTEYTGLFMAFIGVRFPNIEFEEESFVKLN